MQNMNSPIITLEEYDSAKPEHKHHFAELNREWLEKYFYVEPCDEEVFYDPEGAVIAEGGVIFFARANGEIVGTCSLLPMKDGCYEIAKMGVTERWQKHKIGERLLTACITRAQAIPAKKLFIISNTLLEPALCLYRKHGFTDSLEIHHAHYARGNITLERNVA